MSQFSEYASLQDLTTVTSCTRLEYNFNLTQTHHLLRLIRIGMGPQSRTAKDTSGKDIDVSASIHSKTNSESKRLRNRLSQKAFRARQTMRMKELEERLNLEPNSDDTRTAKLQDQNVALRNQLLDCHKKITSLQISINTLAKSTAQALGLETSDDVGLRSHSI